jgi:hypothetical protein
MPKEQQFSMSSSSWHFSSKHSKKNYFVYYTKLLKEHIYKIRKENVSLGKKVLLINE